MRVIYLPSEISWEKRGEFGQDIFYLSYLHTHGFPVPNFFIVHNSLGDVCSGYLGEIYNAWKRLTEYSCYELTIPIRLISNGKEEFLFSYEDIFQRIALHRTMVVQEVPPIFATGKLLVKDSLVRVSYGIVLEKQADTYFLSSQESRVRIQKTKTVFGAGGRIQKVPVEPSLSRNRKFDENQLDELKRLMVEVLKIFPNVSEIRFFISRGKLFIYYLR